MTVCLGMPASRLFDFISQLSALRRHFFYSLTSSTTPTPTHTYTHIYIQHHIITTTTHTRTKDHHHQNTTQHKPQTTRLMMIHGSAPRRKAYYGCFGEGADDLQPDSTSVVDGTMTASSSDKRRHTFAFSFFSSSYVRVPGSLFFLLSPVTGAQA